MAVSASRSRLATALEQMMEAGSDEELAAIVTDLEESDRVALLEMFAAHLGDEAAKQLNALVAEITQSYRPQTRAELWKMMRDECGIRVPRKAVCEGHCAPMDMAEDVYFERGNPDKFAIGNRGSGKTNIMGALHYVKSQAE
jgi:ABC-type iron transport system FetAB ATPase subunit